MAILFLDMVFQVIINFSLAESDRCVAWADDRHGHRGVLLWVAVLIARAPSTECSVRLFR